MEEVGFVPKPFAPACQRHNLAIRMNDCLPVESWFYLLQRDTKYSFSLTPKKQKVQMILTSLRRSIFQLFYSTARALFPPLHTVEKQKQFSGLIVVGHFTPYISPSVFQTSRPPVVRSRYLKTIPGNGKVAKRNVLGEAYKDIARLV